MKELITAAGAILILAGVLGVILECFALTAAKNSQNYSAACAAYSLLHVSTFASAAGACLLAVGMLF